MRDVRWLLASLTSCYFSSAKMCTYMVYVCSQYTASNSGLLRYSPKEIHNSKFVVRMFWTNNSNIHTSRSNCNVNFHVVSMVVYDIQQTAAAATVSVDDVDALLSGLQELSLQSGADPKETFLQSMKSGFMAPTRKKFRFEARCIKSWRDIIIVAVTLQIQCCLC